MALRVFFGLDKQLVADALDVSVQSVESSERQSIAGLQEHIDSVDSESSAVSDFETSLLNGISSEPTTLTTSVSREPKSTSYLSEVKTAERKRTSSRRLLLLLSGLLAVILTGAIVVLAGSDWLLNETDEASQATTTTLRTASNPVETTVGSPSDPVDEADEVESIVEVAPSPETTVPEPTTTQQPDEETTTTTIPFREPVVPNGGFESNRVEALKWASFPTIPGWTASRPIEIWATGHNGVESPGGSHHIELNSTGRNEMTTQVEVSPNSQLRWSVAHRGRKGTDSMRVVFQPASGEAQSWVLETGQEWRTYQFDYLVPPNSDTVTVTFVSITGGSEANLLDNFTIGLKP